MTIEPSQLDALARALMLANGRLVRVTGAVSRGAVEEAGALAEEARTHVWRTVKELERLGATTPAPVTQRRELPLHLLDTEANRNLLACLLETYEAARLVDIERGESPEDGFAAIIESLAADRRDEIGGPVGAGRE